MHKLLLPIFLLATAASGGPLRPIGRLAESYDRNVAVVGTSLVGLEISAATANVYLPQYGATLLPENSGNLCLTATTRDGRYKASQAFQIASSSRIPVPLSATSTISQLPHYVTDDFAMKLEIRTSCSEGPHGVFVPAMRSGNAQPSSLEIKLNLGSDRGFAQLLDDKRQPLTARTVCADIKNGSSTAFDHICVLPIPAASRGKIGTLNIAHVGTSGNVGHEYYRVALP